MRLLGSTVEPLDPPEPTSDTSRGTVAPPTRRATTPAPRRRIRHLAAALLGLGMVAIPLAAAASVAVAAGQFVAPPGGAWLGLWWVAVFLASAAAAWGADHLARRYLPLVGLLRLSLLFPADVGSRLGLALRAGSVRDLERGVIDLRHGEHLDRADAVATIIAYASALQKHDRFTRGHCERVRAYSELLAAELGVPKADRDLLRWAALLHDIGKLEVSPKLLNKPGALDDDEWLQMREHAAAGLRLGEPLRVWLGDWVGAIGQHHERFDGTGYPLGLKGTEISLAARIVTVADSYETMTATRPYKKPMPQRDARAELVDQAGKQFDEDVVRAMLNLSVRRLRWAAGPVAGLGDALVVALLTQSGAAGTLAGVGAAVGGWSPALGAVTPLRMGAVVAAVAAASIAPAYYEGEATGPGPAETVTTEPSTTETPPYGASKFVIDPLLRFGSARHQAGLGSANASENGRLHTSAADAPGASRSGSELTPNAGLAELPPTASSPVLTAPATPAIPGVSPAVPAAPEIPATPTPGTLPPQADEAAEKQRPNP